MVLKKVIYLNKKEGETPLEALESFRSKNKKYKDLKVTYAGRLDPMASGLLLLLVGDKIKEKEGYLKLDKEYNFDVLFGFSTDTYDILGRVEHSHILKNVRMSGLEEKIKDNLKNFTGRLIQEYPAYSSKTVKGKPLFSYAREGVEVEVPTREVLIKSFKFLKVRKISNENLLKNIEKRVKKVKGDFRQKEILKLWNQKLHRERSSFFIASFKIKCSSGTYVRSLAHNLGDKMGIPALAFSIKRTKIGNWSKILK
jgi:tRNA pseudouridine55 synthase